MIRPGVLDLIVRGIHNKKQDTMQVVRVRVTVRTGKSGVPGHDPMNQEDGADKIGFPSWSAMISPAAV